MPVRKADATWNGTLTEGDGTMETESGAYSGAYSFSSRFEEGDASNPEELIGAAHAGCFSMALANELDGAGYDPQSVHTTAEVSLEKGEDGFAITGVHLVTEVEVSDIDEETFQEIAAGAKANCPVSKALAVDITLDASLV